jgi:hypothetical protein
MKPESLILILIGAATLWVLLRQKQSAPATTLGASSQADPLTMVNQIADRIASQLKTTPTTPAT